MKRELGPARAIASSASSSAAAVGADRAEARRAAAELERSAPRCRPGRCRARRRARRSASGRAVAHERHRPRQDRGVGLGVRAAADADQGLADHVVDARTAPSRSRSRRGSSRARGRRGRARPRSWSSAVAISSAPRSAVIARDRVGERRVERVGAVGEGVHRAGPQLGLGLAGHRLGVGDHEAAGGPAPSTRSSAPAGSRWIAGHLGARERRRDRRHLGAGDRGDRLRGVDHPAAAEGDQAVAPDRVEQRRRRLGHLRRTGPRGPAPPRRRASAPPPSARGGASAARTTRSRARRSSSAARRAAARGGRRPCAPRRATNGSSARFTPLRVVGARVDDRPQVRLDLGRRCSKSGGSESFSPRCSSGSSTVKPGPSVAISKSTPLGSRK